MATCAAEFGLGIGLVVTAGPLGRGMALPPATAPALSLPPVLLSLPPQPAALSVPPDWAPLVSELLAPEPAALFRLLNKPPAWIVEGDLQELRQSTEEFNVALSDMAALQERIKLLQEEIAARVAEANNRSLYVLTIVTVLALPINIMAGLFGMNVGGIPLADQKPPHW